MTDTATLPGDPAGTVTDICESLIIVGVASLPPNETLLAVNKLKPLIVIVLPPDVGPDMLPSELIIGNDM